MSSDPVVLGGTSCCGAGPIEQAGQLQDRKVEQWQKPLLIVLAILGLGGLGVAGVGFAAFGTHQHWWVAGLTQISQIDAIIMMSAGGFGGGLLFSISTALLVRKESNPSHTNTKPPLTQQELDGLNQIFGHEEDNIVREERIEVTRPKFTIFRHPKTNLFTIVKRVWVPNQGFATEPAESERPLSELIALKSRYMAEGHLFIKTSPYEPQDLIVSDFALTNMPDSSKDLICFTFVRQIDGKFTLVEFKNSRPQSFAHKDIEPSIEALKRAQNEFMQQNNGAVFFPSSVLPQGMISKEFMVTMNRPPEGIDLVQISQLMEEKELEEDPFGCSSRLLYAFVRQGDDLYVVVHRHWDDSSCQWKLSIYGTHYSAKGICNLFQYLVEQRRKAVWLDEELETEVLSMIDDPSKRSSGKVFSK